MEISLAELIREIADSKNESGHLPFKVGDALFIRPVTYHYTGRVKAIGGGFVTLADAAWIPDSGRWANALVTGELSEVEPYPGDAYVPLLGFIDASPWNHPLPREVK